MFVQEKIKLTVLLLTFSLTLVGCSSNNDLSSSTTTPSTPAASPLAATASPSAQPSPRVVTDDLSNKVNVPANPQRVLAPYLEDALISLGVKPVAQWSAGTLLLNYLQPQLKDIPKLDFVSLAPEAVASFDPDLFIVPFAARVKDGAYDQYAKAAPTYVFQDATKDWRKTLLTLGDLLNKTDKANAALKEYDTKMAAWKASLQNKVAGKNAAIMLISPKSFSLMQDGTYSGKVVYGELGFQTPAMAKGSDWKELSLEVLPELNADYIFLLQVDGADPLKNKDLSSIYDTAVWKTLKAVKDGHVYSVDRDYWINTGLLANEKVAENVKELLDRP